MTGACTSQPISWLRLEQYALGELPAEERSTVSAHLEECDACRTCMQKIREHDPAALPALPDTVVSAPAPWWRRHRMRVAWGSGFAAAATAAATIALILVSRDPGVGGEASIPGRRTQLKGGELVLDMVRERGGSIAYEPDTFLLGDRFKVLITCPSEAMLHTDVVVFQGGEASFPLRATTMACGNRVAVPGAFRLTGDLPATVCALLREDAPPDRDSIAETRPEKLDGAVCTTLRPGTGRP